MAFTLSSNMNLPIPGVGTEQGPNYATDVNNSLTLIDRHDHSLGSGVQITPAGININSTLDFQVNNAINISTISMSALGSASATIQSLSVAPGGGTGQEDLWYTDGAGVPIQITKSGQVNVIASAIPGESYAAGTFIWTQTQDSLPTTPANFDIGSITIRPNTAATTDGITLAPPGAIASAYTLTLPNNPSLLAGTAFLTMTTVGIISGSIQTALGITAANLASDSVITSKILNANVTAAKIAAGVLETQHIIDYGSSGSFVVPADVSYIEITGVGGGGGGAGGQASGTGGGGGGAGSSPWTTLIAVTPSETLTVTIGAAGVGGGSNSPGSIGGNTQVLRSSTILFNAKGVPGGVQGAAGSGGAGGTGASTAGSYNSGGGAGGNAGQDGIDGTSGFNGAGGTHGNNGGGNGGGGGGGSGWTGAVGGAAGAGGGSGQGGTSSSCSGAGGGGAGAPNGSGGDGGGGYLRIKYSSKL